MIYDYMTISNKSWMLLDGGQVGARWPAPGEQPP